MINDILLDQNFLLLIAQGWANSQEIGQLYKKLTHGGRRGLMERALSRQPGGLGFASRRFHFFFAGPGRNTEEVSKKDRKFQKGTFGTKSEE